MIWVATKMIVPQRIILIVFSEAEPIPIIRFTLAKNSVYNIKYQITFVDRYKTVDNVSFCICLSLFSKYPWKSLLKS